MSNIFRRIIAVFVFLFSTSVFADSYPAHVGGFAGGYTSGQAYCDNNYGPGAAVYNETTYHCVRNDDGSNRQGPTFIYDCPYGGDLDLSVTPKMCIDAPACVVSQVRNSVTYACQTPPTCTGDTIYDNPSNSCSAPSLCTGSQKPTTHPCKFPSDKGLGISCADGSTVYPPMVCPATGSRWQDTFPAPKHMCSPLDVDHSNCTPTLFQRIDDFASSHAIQYMTAALALMTIPELAAIPAITAGVATEAEAIWNGVFHNSAGEIVDFKVAADVPKTTMGDAVSDFFKADSTSPYAAGFPAAYNAAAPQAPIIIEPTGVVHPVDSTIPLSSNQLWDAVKDLSTTIPIPYSQISPFVAPERIPWLAEAQPALDFDLKFQNSPQNYPQLHRETSPVQYQSPSYQVSPSPIETTSPVPRATPQSVSGLNPIPFTPLTPAPVSPIVPTSTQPPSAYNPNPTGTDSPTTPSTTTPNPLEPIDPAAPELPPVPPEIFPDTYKYFDWLPMSNPLAFDVHNYIPTLPEPSCYYEIHRTFHVPLLGNKNFDLAPCVPLQPLRTVLAWVFSVLTLFTCFFVIFRSQM